MVKVVLVLVVLLLLVGCSSSSIPTTRDVSDSEVVGITIREGSISADSIVEVGNFYPGARAEMVYRIHNATTRAVIPDIYIVDGADITNYSKANGAVKAPDYALEWIELPKLVEVKPGVIEDFVVAIQMPKDKKKFAEKWGFQIGVASTSGEKVQVAVGIWWLVNMR